MCCIGCTCPQQSFTSFGRHKGNGKDLNPLSLRGIAGSFGFSVGACNVVHAVRHKDDEFAWLVLAILVLVVGCFHGVSDSLVSRLHGLTELVNPKGVRAFT